MSHSNEKRYYIIDGNTFDEDGSVIEVVNPDSKIPGCHCWAKGLIDIKHAIPLLHKTDAIIRTEEAKARLDRLLMGW